jgi:ribosomal protein L13
MKTTTLTPKDIKREWHFIDLSDQVLGRAAVKIAHLISGKGKILPVTILIMVTLLLL